MASPPDLGVHVGDSIETAEAFGEVIVIEQDKGILKQWVKQAFDTQLRVVILNYINRVHPNADMKLAGELVDEHIKDQRARISQNQGQPENN